MLLTLVALVAVLISVVSYARAVKGSTQEGVKGKQANVTAAFWCSVMMVVSFLALEQFARWMGDYYHLAAR